MAVQVKKICQFHKLCPFNEIRKQQYAHCDRENPEVKTSFYKAIKQDDHQEISGIGPYKPIMHVNADSYFNE